MSEDQPRTSALKLALILLTGIAMVLAGIALLWTHGRAFDVRGPWQVSAVLSLIAGPGCIYACYRLAFLKKPVLVILPDRVEHYAWPDPVYFDDVQEVIFEKGSFWSKTVSSATLLMTSGERRTVFTLLLNRDAKQIADLLQAALTRRRCSASPLS